jgi:biopolymer transport protein TolR
VARLQDALESASDRTVYLKGDREAPYGAIMSMMDALRMAGIESVGLITEPKDKEQGGQ